MMIRLAAVALLFLASALAQTQPRITTTSLPAGSVGTTYSQTLAVTGGTAPYTWSIVSGSLPTGILLVPLTNTLVGIPLAAGTSNFTVRVRDSAARTDDQALTLVVRAALAVTTSSLPNATVGTAYSQTLAASGGSGGNTWSVTAGTLPQGLTLSGGGTITGNPSSPGTSNFTVQVTDSSDAKATRALSLIVNPVPLTVTTASLPGATVGTAYSQTLAASGGTGGNTWAVTAGTLPQGLTLSGAGAITGNPSSPGTSNFTVQVTDSSNAKATKALSLIVNPVPLTVTTASLPGATVGTAYSQTLAASGGTGGNTWAVTAGTLPQGLTLSGAGAITGNPSSPGTSNFTVQVTDSSNAKATKALSLVVSPVALTVTTSSLPNATVGTAYSQTLAASGGTGGYTWAVTTGTLPQGLTLSGAGAITGTPSSPGTSNFTVQVTDSSDAKATKALSLIVNPAALTVTTASLPNGTVGTGYSQTLAASGGTGGYTWAVTAGTLPQGLTLSGAGAITGTPSSPGTSNFTVQVTDSSSAKATKALSLIVNPAALTVTTSSLPNGTVGTGYSQTLTATGGTGGNTWSVTAGALPQGLTLSAAGAISGTPTAAGAANFTVQVADSGGTKATKAFTISVDPAALSVTTSSLPNGTVGTSYSQTLAASGGTGGNAWSVTAGALPQGLTLSAAGAITGTPTATGTANFTVQVADSSGTKATKALTLTVDPAALSVTTSSLPNGTVGTSYSQTLTASGGTGGNTWSVTAGALPQGLTLSGAGAITGTPTATGTANFTVQVADSSGTRATKALTISVDPAALSVTTSSLPNGTVGTSYSQTLAASGGTGGNAWSVTAGALPQGLTLSAAGAITGTPTATGAANFTVQVADGSGTRATKALTLTVDPAALSISTSSLPNATVGAGYSQTLSATGGAGGTGSGGNTWSITSGSLPQGLSLSGAGAITGTPTAAGTATFTVQVADSSGTTATKALTLTVDPATLSVSTATLPNGTSGAAYSQTLAATGGTGGNTWSVTSGSLPQGLSLSGAGAITGTPTATGTANFTVQVADSSGTRATKALTLTIDPPTLSVSTASLPNGTVGAAYSQTLAATGGTGGNTWSTTSGSLPQGLSLSGTGAITGTPTATGTANFTVQVADSSGTRATKALTIAVDAAALSISTSSLPNATVGTAYSQTLNATGGTGGYSWTLTSGTLPQGLSLGNSGAITGTPTAAVTANLTFQVSDSAGTRATRTIALTVAAAALAITTSSVPNGTAGAPYSYQLESTGGRGGNVWSVASGALPDGVALNASGRIAGTPRGAGSFAFTVQTSDAAQMTARRDLVLAVLPGISITSTSLPDALGGTRYTATLAATGGLPPYKWALISGSLPTGLTLNATTGAISGTPTLPGRFDFTAQATDAAAIAVARGFSITVGATLQIQTQSSLASGSIGSPYSQPLTATGGNGPYTWAVTEGALPRGLGINQIGTITGTPTQAGAFTVTIEVTDTASTRARGTFNITIVSGLTIATQPVLPAGTVGQSYAITLQGAGGNAPFVWTVTAGALPPGLVFHGDGKLDGTPSGSGDFSFTVQLQDGNAAMARKDFTLRIAGPLTITTGPDLPEGAVRAAYSQPLTGAGGQQPYLWSVTAGAMPPGLTLEGPTGTVSGLPTASGEFRFTVELSDATLIKTQRNFSMVVRPGLTITDNGAVPDATAGTPYNYVVQITGGAAPFTWRIAAGQLPDGLAFDPGTGAVTGIPTSPGTYSFTLEVTDSTGAVAARLYSLGVLYPPLPSITIDNLPDTLTPSQQPRVQLTLSNSYPVALTGRLVLAYKPSAANPVDDPAVQFSTGGRTVTFRIPANGLQAEFPVSLLALQSGTTAGDITVSVENLTAGPTMTAPSPATRTAKLPASAPVMRGIEVTRVAGGFRVQISGVTTTRELVEARVRFIPRPGADLITTDTVVALDSVSKTWFQKTESSPYGGQFVLTLPFSFQGSSDVLDAVAVSLANTSGASAELRGTY